MQIRPYFMFHGDQSIRRATSSSSLSSLIRQLINFVDELTKIIFFQIYFCLLDNVSGRIECKLGRISNSIAISHSEGLRQVRQFVNSSI